MDFRCSIVTVVDDLIFGVTSNNATWIGVIFYYNFMKINVFFLINSLLNYFCFFQIKLILFIKIIAKHTIN